MSAYQKKKVLVLDGCAENFDKWDIQWGAFAEVLGLSSALGNSLDINMPESSAIVINTADSKGELRAVAVKTIKESKYKT